MKVLVLSEAASAELASSLVAELRAAGLECAARALPRFPTGDGLPALLHSASPLADVVLVCLSGSHESRWMSRELSLRSLYPTFAPAFAGASALSAPWTSADALVPGAEPAAAFARRLARR